MDIKYSNMFQHVNPKVQTTTVENQVRVHQSYVFKFKDTVVFKFHVPNFTFLDFCFSWCWGWNSESCIVLSEYLTLSTSQVTFLHLHSGEEYSIFTYSSGTPKNDSDRQRAQFEEQEMCCIDECSLCLWLVLILVKLVMLKLALQSWRLKGIT